MCAEANHLRSVLGVYYFEVCHYKYLGSRHQFLLNSPYLHNCFLANFVMFVVLLLQAWVGKVHGILCNIKTYRGNKCSRKFTVDSSVSFVFLPGFCCIC